jgi:hypothetical protein
MDFSKSYYVIVAIYSIKRFIDFNKLEDSKFNRTRKFIYGSGSIFFIYLSIYFLIN